MRAPIHSRKHYFQVSQSQVVQSAILNSTIAVSIEGAASQPQSVSEGAIIKAVWVEMWLQNDSASVIGSFTAGFYKAEGGANTISAGDAAALHDYNNKKNIFYATQGLAPASDSNMQLLYKGWIKIPKSKQRMGLGDSLVFFVRNNNATAIDLQVCGIFTYKEYQ